MLPTQNAIIDNSTETLSMLNVLRGYLCLPDFSTLKIATGYWDLPGLSLVYDELSTFLQREDTTLQLLIGTDPVVRTYQLKTPIEKGHFPGDYIRRDIHQLEVKEEYQRVVELLIRYLGKKQDNAKVQICLCKQNAEGDAQFLHAKCYIFKGAKRALGIIGSSNFTKRGLQDNAELNYLETNSQIVTAEIKDGNPYKGHIQWFDEKWADATDWSAELLEELVQSPNLPTKTPQPLTPYETYIRLLSDRFGALADCNMETILRSYLPPDIRPLQYQLDAAALCYQTMHQHGGFLLGDVVGLGKTIVGVLLLKYYLEVAEQEGRDKKALIIVPPAIKSSWEKTIRLFDKNRNDAIMPYVDFITTGSIAKLMEGDEDEDTTTGTFDTELPHYTYGLILIDESHNFRNNGTQMYENLNDLIEEIGLKRGVYPYIGLLSATIQNNCPEDIRNQIYLFQRKPSESTLAVEGHNLEHFFADVCKRYHEIINQHPTGKDEIRANRKALIFLSEEIHNKVLSELLVRRTRTDVKKDYHEDLHFPEVIGPAKLIYTLNPHLSKLFYDTMALIAPTQDNLQSNGKGIVYMRYRATEYLNKDLQKRYSGKNMSPEKSSSRLARIMQILLVKRLESSFTAFRESLENLQRYTRNMLQMWEDDCIFVCPQIDVNAELNVAAKRKKDAAYTLERCYEDIRRKIARLNKEGRNTKQQNAEYRREDFNPAYYDLLCEDIRYIDDLVNRWGKEYTDPKLLCFNLAIRQELFDKDKNRPQKLVVFSEAIATVNEIAGALADARKRVLTITAANRDKEEENIRANFDANYEGEQRNDYDAIVTTEVLAEGVNLHRANTILNYDTPWNSTRLIQRIGRVNRIGSQEDKVYVYNFYPSAEGDAEINLVQRAYTKLQSFHTLFGEDNRIFSEEEELSEVDYKKLLDDQETPYTKYIAQLQHYKNTCPERFAEIIATPAPLATAYQATGNEALFVIKTNGNKAGAQYISVTNEKTTILSCLEMLQKCECAEDTPCCNTLVSEEQQKASLQAYNAYMSKIYRAATGRNKNIEDARLFIRHWIAVEGVSQEAKQRLSIASRIIGKGDIALAKKVVALSEQVIGLQQSLFETTQEQKIQRVNEIIERELQSLNQSMIKRYGEPYIYLSINKVNNEIL